MLRVLARAAGLNLVDDEVNDENQEQQGAEENPGRDGYAIAANRCRRRRMHGAEDRDCVFVHDDVLAQVYRAEEGNEIPADA